VQTRLFISGTCVLSLHYSLLLSDICSLKPNIWKDNLASKQVTEDAVRCNAFRQTSSVL